MHSERERQFHCDLTGREVRIIGLVAGGFSSKEIAQALGIAPSTVESHLESAKSKLRARSRPHLIAKAIACGAIDPEDDADPADALDQFDVAHPDDQVVERPAANGSPFGARTLRPPHDQKDS